MKLMNDFIKILNEFYEERFALEVNVLLRFTSSKSGAKRSLLGAPLGEGALSVILEHPNRRLGGKQQIWGVWAPLKGYNFNIRSN